MYEFAFKYIVFPRIVSCLQKRFHENDNRVGDPSVEIVVQ